MHSGRLQMKKHIRSFSNKFKILFIYLRLFTENYAQSEVMFAIFTTQLHSHCSTIIQFQWFQLKLVNSSVSEFLKMGIGLGQWDGIIKPISYKNRFQVRFLRCEQTFKLSNSDQAQSESRTSLTDRTSERIRAEELQDLWDHLDLTALCYWRNVKSKWRSRSKSFTLIQNVQIHRCGTSDGQYQWASCIWMAFVYRSPCLKSPNFVVWSLCRFYDMRSLRRFIIGVVPDTFLFFRYNHCTRI